jgi:hypothetical protein
LKNNEIFLKYTNLVTLIASLVYVAILFINKVNYTPAQIGFVFLIAIIAYRTFKKPDLIWTLLAAVSLIGMWFSLK